VYFDRKAEPMGFDLFHDSTCIAAATATGGGRVLARVNKTASAAPAAETASCILRQALPDR
jgi:hypothetical protein